MIYKLRNKFILISALSLIVVLVSIYLAIFFINTRQLEENMDTLTDMITFEKGRPPGFIDIAFDEPDDPGDTDDTDDMDDTEDGDDEPDPPDDRPGIKRFRRENFINRETKFSTRYFTVEYDTDGDVFEVNVDHIASVTSDEAEAIANTLIKTSVERGWYQSYRYKIIKGFYGKKVVFVDGTTNRELSSSFLVTSAVVLFGSGAIVLFLIIFFSNKAVRPVAESYEKQKQFVTDANHELKTPLTLILANLDIAEAELGKNEWLEDIRYEGEQMATLVERLVSLSKMDEDATILVKERINLSEIMLDVTSEFHSAAESAGIAFYTDITPEIFIDGEEASLRQLMSILLENAMKYCDKKGQICCTLKKGRRAELTVTNSFKEVDNTELNRLFDRFYRSNKARTSGTGFGIGLSIAKAVVGKHGGKILAYKAGEGIIGFKAEF